MTLAGLSTARTFNALRHADYRRFWWGGLVSLTGSWMRITALSWLVYDMTRSPLMLGTVTFANTIPTMLLALFGGALADRSEKRYLLLITQACFMAMAAVLAVLTLSGRIEVWHILAFSIGGGIAGALDMPARQSFIPHLVPREDLTNAIALNSAAFNGSRIVGPAAAGLIINAFGPRGGPGVSFAVNAVTYLAVISALLAIRVTSRPEDAERKPVLHDVREGLVYAWHSASLRMLLGLLAVAGTFGFFYVVLLPVFARDVLGVEARGFGMLMTASGFGSTIGALGIASVDLVRPFAVILGLMAAFTGLLAGFALTTDYAMAIVLMVAVSGTMTAFMSAGNTTIQQITPDALRGRLMSLYVLALFGTGPLGGLLAGSLASLLGAQVAVLLSAAVCGVAALAGWVTRRRESGRLAFSPEGQP
ncbi:MAG: MFS transporter [Armatimonadota bacterium]|nr:MFS transporter [Armatimonadota bacterium]